MKKIVRGLLVVFLFSMMVVNVNCNAQGATHRSQWVENDKGTFYFNKEGKKVKGVQKIGNSYYVFDPDTGELEKNHWVRVNGYIYHTYETGKMMRGRVVMKDHTYYFAKDGKRKTGWRKLDGKYYFFNNSQAGAMEKSKTINHVKLGKNGSASSGNSKKFMETLVIAQNIVDQQTKPTMSKEEKLKKCFAWVIAKPYITRRASCIGKKDWIPIYANDILVGTGGNCLSDGASFGYLANALGYKNIFMCTDSEHGWTEIEGKVFDPLFAEDRTRRHIQSSYYSNYYRMSYAAYRLTAVTHDRI